MKTKINITQQQYNKALMITYILGLSTGVLFSVIAIKTIQVWEILK